MAGAPFPQHRLNLTPEPQVQWGFRPIMAAEAGLDWVCFVKANLSF
jgi:hypothetical protein